MSRRRLGLGLAWLLALALALGSFLPIFWILLTSFKTYLESQVTPPVWPSVFNFDNYVKQFSGPESGLDSLVRSLIVATATMLITMAVAIPAAYSLARYRIAGKNQIQFWIISTRMMPVIAAIIPLATLLQVFGLFDTLSGLIIVYTAGNLSFSVWLLSIFFHSVPEEIEQAARVDGVSRIGVLWYITVPMARASIFVVALFTWIFPWNELLDALVLTTGANATLPVFLSKFVSNVQILWPGMSAVAMVQILPAIIVTFVIQRYIVSGLSLGALSGE